MSVSVQTADFDAGVEMAALSAGRDDVGAVASFIGLVRADGRGKVGGEKVGAGETAANGENPASVAVAAMTLEHYPGMTEAELALNRRIAGR